MMLCSSYCIAMTLPCIQRNGLAETKKGFRFGKTNERKQNNTFIQVLYKLRFWLLALTRNYSVPSAFQTLCRGKSSSRRCSWTHFPALEINPSRSAGLRASPTGSGLIQWPCCFPSQTLYPLLGCHPPVWDLSWFVDLRHHYSFYLFQKGYVLFHSQIMFWKFKRKKRAKSLRGAVWLWLQIKL